MGCQDDYKATKDIPATEPVRYTENSPIVTLTAEQEVTDHDYGDTDDIRIPVSLSNDFRCGGVDDEFTCRFSVSARMLDRGGFVFEVASLIKAIRDAYRPEKGQLKASCEELALGVVNVFGRLLGDRLVSAHVEVDNLTGYVAVDWEDGDDEANFPRLVSGAEANPRYALPGEPVTNGFGAGSPKFEGHSEIQERPEPRRSRDIC